MSGKLSTHVLDTAHGHPAAGMKIELWRFGGEQRHLLKTFVSNSDGRTDAPLLAGQEMALGLYELVFFAGDYFAAQPGAPDQPGFLERVPVRFRITDSAASYHVPLLVSPWSYTTYRGS